MQIIRHRPRYRLQLLLSGLILIREVLSSYKALHTEQNQGLLSILVSSSRLGLFPPQLVHPNPNQLLQEHRQLGL